ncbi:hypothetical protein EUGRSUZ_H01440 [Eucalyptus grandis]|uniref:Uncharacterized protein n=2 Tax=Eucalyptus grandis TaxID=71139 RepID=A0A059AZE2_EUCGR|nr:hypothetical protein EUGRSUZ_H01440 [Eucalyptus grandis]
MSIIPPPARHLLPLTTATIDFPSKPSSRSFHSSTAPIAGADLSVFSLGCFNPSHFCAAWPRRKRLSSSQQTWLRGIMRRDQDVKNSDFGEESEMQMLSSEDDAGTEILIQAQSLMEGYGPVLASEYKPVPEVDYLQELLAIQQQGPRAIGFFGTRNMGFMHQELTEILSYAMVITIRGCEYDTSRFILHLTADILRSCISIV